MTLDRSFLRTLLLWVAAIPAAVLMMSGCDSVPGRVGAQERPRVSGLQVVTDSVQISQADSVAQIDVTIAARATDPDGTVRRVVFTLEPASNPRGTATGDLNGVEGTLYAGRLQLTVPLAQEVYTVRVFAIDDDDLSSNQVTGQFRFDPSDYQSGSTSSAALGERGFHPLHQP